MIRSKMLKWVAAGALAVAVVPAIGMARHSHTVAASVTPTALTPVKHTLAAKGKSTTSKLVSHKKATPSKLTSHKKVTPAKHVTHKKSTSHATSARSSKHSTKHHVAKKSSSKKHPAKKH